ncbi:MAG: flagellar biosynthesis protein FlhB [Eubacterium sp.]|jgi:Uncharacterized homolog of the cytoplasmic domain of flagellar protein FhlB|nr:flagellar biosynthesis protein FlhB [Eubacterium sp.]
MAQREEKKTAVALEYEAGDRAPKVVATGQGVLAEKIIDVAKEANVPVHKDEKLARSLSILDIGEYIPPELYSIVAEILVFVDGMDRIQSKLQHRKK